MKGLALPKIGARNLKTALAVTLCIGFFELIHRQYPFYACIAAVICMKDTVENSYKMGKSNEEKSNKEDCIKESWGR